MTDPRQASRPASRPARAAVSWDDDEELPEPARALLALTVPDDVAARHLTRLTTLRTTPATVAPLRRRTGLRAGAAGFVFAATLASGAGVAAAGPAQPGDALYGLKTARERLQLAMARPGDSRARLELKLARTRLGEAAALLRAGDAALAVETLARADAALASAGAHGGAEVDREVEAELDRRVEVLGGLLDGGLPAPAADAAREAIERAVERDRPAAPPVQPPVGRPSETPRPSDKPTKKPTPADVRPSRAATPTERPDRTEHPTGRPAGKGGRGR